MSDPFDDDRDLGGRGQDGVEDLGKALAGAIAAVLLVVVLYFLGG